MRVPCPPQAPVRGAGQQTGLGHTHLGSIPGLFIDRRPGARSFFSLVLSVKRRVGGGTSTYGSDDLVVLILGCSTERVLSKRSLTLW